jgi:hypothetical protein
MSTPNDPEASIHITRKPADTPGSIQAELEIEQRKSARLLHDFALALYNSAGRVPRSVTQAAHYLQGRYVREAATGAGRLIRRNPGAAVLAAVVAGFLIGRAIRRR